jgi:hypothetical protein
MMDSLAGQIIFTEAMNKKLHHKLTLDAVLVGSLVNNFFPDIVHAPWFV